MIGIGSAHKFVFTPEYQAMLPSNFFGFPQRYLKAFGEQLLMKPFGPVGAAGLLMSGFGHCGHAF